MKRPSFQFYPGDWLQDASLRVVSVGARGLWMEMICLMHQGSDYGYLKVNGKVILTSNLARMCGATLHEVEGWLAELNDAGVYSIDDNDCIYSRRMIRDEEIREARAAGGIKGGNPKLMEGKKVVSKVNLPDNLPPTPSSSSSSSSSSSIKTNTPAEYSAEFELAWAAYPARPGANKKDSFGAWKARVKAGVDSAVMIAGAKKYAIYCNALGTDPQYIKQPSTFFGKSENYLLDWSLPATNRKTPPPDNFAAKDYGTGISDL